MIITIGPLPPPLHGASLITQRVIERLAQHNFPVTVCNTSPGPTARRSIYHFNRLIARLRCIITIFKVKNRVQNRKAIYLSLSGGFGLLYDLLTVAAARWAGYDIIFH